MPKVASVPYVNRHQQTKPGIVISGHLSSDSEDGQPVPCLGTLLSPQDFICGLVYTILKSYAAAVITHAQGAFTLRTTSYDVVRGRTMLYDVVRPRMTSYVHAHPTSCDVVRSVNAPSLRHIRPLLTLDVAKMVVHSVASSRLDYANALLHGTSANNLCRLLAGGTQLARVWCVKHHVPPVLPSNISSSTGCQFANVSPTIWRSSRTRHYLLELQLTYLISSTTIYQNALYDRPTNYYFQYLGCR